MCTVEGVHAQNDSEILREKRKTLLTTTDHSLKQLMTLCEN